LSRSRVSNAQRGGGNSQRPDVQGKPLQQSVPTVQIWPYWAHAPPPPLPASVGVPPPLPASGTAPPSGPPPQGPHTPAVLPGIAEHVEPGQQSAVVVQGPQLDTHDVP
jgi:hypothetical protein